MNEISKHKSMKQLLLLLASSIPVILASATNDPSIASVYETRECSDFVKACDEMPISATDIKGMQICYQSPNVASCYTTISPPFFCCVCRDGFSGDQCEQRSDTMMTAKMTTESHMIMPQIFVIGGDSPANAGQLVEAYDFQKAKWNRMPSLPYGRFHPGTATLNTKIYAIDGSSGLSVRETVEIFDPLTQNWTPGPIMNSKRVGFGVSVFDEKIYVIGGWNGTTRLSSVEMFNPQLRKWTEIGQGMNTQRKYLATGVLNGSIYAFGGSSEPSLYLNTVEKMNPATGVWSFVAPMNTARAVHCAAVLNGKLYAIGGSNIESGYLKSVEAYDPLSDHWTMVSSLIHPRHASGAVSYNGRIYVVGGVPNLDSTEVYNPQTNTWIMLPARLSSWRYGHGITLL